MTALRTLNRKALALEDTIKPGSALVYDLRSNNPALERLARSEVRGALREVGGRVAAASYTLGGIKLSEAEVPDPQTQARIDSIIQHSRLDAWKSQQLTPVLERIWSRAARTVEQTLDKHGIYAPVRKRVEERMRETAIRRAALIDMDKSTRDAMYKVLELAKQLNIDTRDVGRLIEHFVPAGRFVYAGSAYRSRLIARSESLESSRHASLAVYSTSPFVEKVIAFDGVEHDSECAQRNGNIFTIEEAERENGKTHPLCVLTWAPV